MKNKKILFIFISSVITGTAQQPLFLGFLAWFSLIPFIYVLTKINSYKEAIKLSFLWGFVYHLITIYWLSQNIGTIQIVAFLSLFLAVFYLSFNTVLIVVIWYFLKIKNKKFKIFLIPIVWVSIEYIKSYGLLAFPWVSLANTQLDYLYLIQIVEYTGIYGITFWIVLINVLFFYLYQNKIIEKIYLFFIIFLIPWIFGFIIFNNVKQFTLEGLNVSMIQPNINLLDSRDYSKGTVLLNKLIDKTKSTISNNTKLVIWPEAALPFHNINNGKTFDYIKNNLLNDNNISILSGDITSNNDKVYNSVVLFDKNGIKSIYNKQRPVPLAEQVPLSELFPALSNMNLGVANYASGNKDVLFNIGEYKFSSLICYESTFPEINRRHVNKGADFITFLVNDAWYTHGPEPKQHSKQSIFRAIENRKSVLRCANTGISMIINPNGNVIRKTALNTDDIIVTNIKGTDYKTFYTKFGNVFAIILLIIMGALILRTIFIYEKNN